MTGISPYAAYHRLQDDAIRHAPPYPATRFSGRGIVMAAGGPLHFTGAWVVLNILRQVHNCQLPVQLWYLGPHEMSPAMIDLLRPLGVECVDARRVRTRHPARRLGGWECKPFALIHSPFQEVIWIDADNTPLYDPEALFDDDAYRETGALFWPDVTSLPPRHPIWEICRVPWRNEPEFESGQIVLDKARCWDALLLTMHLNEWSDFYYQHVWGDKETFHMAWRMLDRPFGMPAKAPRVALGRWPHAPETDGGTLTLFQHDRAGREAFHHRTGIAKWSLYGDSLSFEGFPLEDASLEAIAALRERWDGRVSPAPAPAVPAATESDITAARLFRYTRRGLDERPLELRPDGRIGQGAGAAEQSWRLEPATATADVSEADGTVPPATSNPAGADGSSGSEPGPALVLAGDHGDICRLTLAQDGVWRGRWRLFERVPVELIPCGDAATNELARVAPTPPTPATPSIKPTLLYVSPVIPAATGNGLAMRAGAVLLRLAERYAVTLVVAPLYPSPDAAVPAAFASRCQRVLVVRDAAEAEAALGDLRFAVLHAFRMAMLPVAGSFKARAAAWHLDLDDIESETNARLAELADLDGDVQQAKQYRAAAVHAATVESRVLDTFQRVYVCSEADRRKLADRGSVEVVVLPNTVPVQGPLPPPPPAATALFTFLFVGTLGYLPNADGVRWFCDAVLPALREAAPGPFRVVVAGVGADERLRALDAMPDVSVIGAVPALSPCYRDAHAIIVPLRGGGGTRIKVLEAFSYRRPVVSTTIGVQGIEATPGEHLLVADSPADFAAACARLMTEPETGRRLVGAAHALFLRHYASSAASQP